MIMRKLWVTRSNRPFIASISQFFLSLTTGTVLIIHQKYFTPIIITSDGVLKLQSIMLVLLVVTSLCKCLFLSLLVCLDPEKSRGSKQQQYKILPYSNLIYPGFIKSGTLISIIILLSTKQRLNFTIVSICTLIFIYWLSWCSKDNALAKTIDKGRNFNSNPVKMGLLISLVTVASILQPIAYEFTFQLHFEIFIIFTSSFLVFCYFYLQKLVLALNPKEKNLKILCCQSYVQLISLILLWIYYIIMENEDFSFTDQLTALAQSWYAPFILSLLSILYEVILWQHIRKLALSQLSLTLSTGFLWFNIYYMSSTQMDVRLYVSSMIMLAVLLTNIGLFSSANCKNIYRLWAGGKERNKRRSLKEEKEHFDDQD